MFRLVDTYHLDIRECLIFKCPSLKIVVQPQLFIMNSSKSIGLIEKSFMEKFINIWGCNNQKKEKAWCSVVISNHQVLMNLYVALDILK